MPTDLRSLVAPARTTLLLQELQDGVVGASSAFPELAAAGEQLGLCRNAASLAAEARMAGVTVVHCTAENLPGGFGVNRNARLFAAARKLGADNLPGTASVQPVAEIGVGPGDIVLPRYHGLSPLTGSSLDSLLRNKRVETLVVAGVSLNVAIPNLVFDAVNKSYQVVVVADAVVGTPIEFGEAVLRYSLALVATLTTTAKLVEAWRGSPAS